LHWHGRLYGTGLENTRLFKRWHVYYGVWGSRFFQSIYETGPGTFGSFMLAPEWFLVIVLLGSLTLMGLLWAPLLLALPLLIVAAGPPIVYAVIRGWKATFPAYQTGGWKRPALHALVALLHLLQPLARLAGRLAAGLTPWRRRGLSNYALPRPRSLSMWREKYQAPEARLERLESIYHERGAVILRGGQFDRWDLEIRGGLLGGLRILMASENHDLGRQMIRYRLWPKLATIVLIVVSLLAVLTLLSAMQGAWPVSVLLGLLAAALFMRAVGDCAAAMDASLRAIEQIRNDPF
ncbi:MAG: glycosyl transferase, partial [Chloroflexota bacterium]